MWPSAFGDTERNLGFAGLALRGPGKVTHKRRLVATGRNVRKLFLAESRKSGTAIA